MKRTVVLVAALWLALTALGEYLAVAADFYPASMSDKGDEIEKAFRILLVLAVPVFTGVVAVLLYNVLRHGAARTPPEDGPPLRGRGPVPLTWFAVTSGLTVLIMVYPGLTSLGAVIGGEEEAEIVVQVEGMQWTWFVSYPEQGVSRAREMVLPVDRTVRFDITSLDVLHSFWVPSFLMKIDAVPGRTTTVTLRPTDTGSYETQPLLRVQCAELCGLSHSRMMIPVSVVSDEEFDKWVAEQKEAAPPTATPGAEAATLEIAAENLLFDKDSLEAPAGKPFAIKLDNRDAGTMHNISIYADGSARESLFMADIFPGPEVRTYQVAALDAGEYFFRCDVHPTTMSGTLVVK